MASLAGSIFTCGPLWIKIIEEWKNNLTALGCFLGICFRTHPWLPTLDVWRCCTLRWVCGIFAGNRRRPPHLDTSLTTWCLWSAHPPSGTSPRLVSRSNCKPKVGQWVIILFGVRIFEKYEIGIWQCQDLLPFKSITLLYSATASITCTNNLYKTIGSPTASILTLDMICLT